jgi:hypothetical protein
MKAKTIKPNTRLRVIIDDLVLYGTKKSFYNIFGEYKHTKAYDEVIKLIEAEGHSGAGLRVYGVNMQVNVLQ